MVRLSDDWSFTGGGSILSDDNTNLADAYEKPITGFLIDGTISMTFSILAGNRLHLA